LDDPRITGVVMLENSGFDGAVFREMAERQNRFAREFEYIRIAPSAIPKGVHYGWAEFKMLDEGIQASRLCRSARYIYKATGRYTYPNVSSYLDSLPPETEVSVHCRNYKLPWTRRILGVYAGAFLATPKRYGDHIKGAWMDLGDQLDVIEVALWRRVVPLGGQPGVLLRFPVPLQIHGSGGCGDNLSERSRHIKWLIRSLLAKVFPWWWI